MSRAGARGGGDSSPISFLQVHELHEELERLLARGQAPVIALLLQAAFLGRVIELGASVWAAYAFPVALSMMRKIQGGILDGFSPEEIARLQSTVDRCSDLPVTPWPGASGWSDAVEKARRELAAAQSRVGVLLGGEGVSLGTGWGSGDQVGSVILLPVVVAPNGAREGDPVFGAVRAAKILTLRVGVEALLARGRSPRLTLDGDVAQETREALQRALGSLEALAVRHAPAASRCWFHAAWDTSGGRLIGRSAALPFLLAAACARSRLAAGVTDLGIPPGIAATGDLEGTRVRPVDPAGLGVKIEACFYGPVRGLLLPAEQRAAALEHVRTLERKHPGRQLSIRGVEDAAALWQDPTAVVARPRAWRAITRAAARRLAWSRAFYPAIAGILVLLLAIAARQVWLYRDRPQTAQWVGESLVVKNASGNVCWVRHLPPGPGEVLPGPDPVLGIWDLDGDGTNEVVAILWNPVRRADRLCVWNHGGRRLWMLSSYDLLSPGDSLVQDVCWFRISPVEGEGREREPLRLLAVRRSVQHGLCLIDLVDGVSGRRLGILRNNGHMERVCRVDLDGDGRLEFCLAGQDNGSGEALLSVVDPSRMRCPAAAELDAIPSLTDPSSLASGVTLSLRLPKPRFSPAQRAACLEVTREEEGEVLLSIEGGEMPGAVLAYLRFPDLAHPVMDRVVFTDHARAVLLAGSPPRWSVADLDEEEARLAASAERLTPSGWSAVPPDSISSRR